MAEKDTITTKFKVDISDLKRGITEANKNIKLANAEFKAASAGMDMWTKSSDGIKAKLTQLQTVLNNQVTKLKAYKDELGRIETAEQENEKRAQSLKAKLQELAEAGVSKTSAEYKKYEKALNDVEKEQLSNKKAADSLKTTILNQQGAVDATVRDMRNWKTSLNEVTSQETRANSETGKLTKQISDQESELARLKEKYKDVVLAEGQNSDSARELSGQIDRLSSDLRENKSRMNEVDHAADQLDHSLDEVEDGASRAGEGFTVMKGALANLVADGIRRAIDGFKELAKQSVVLGASFDSAMSQVEAVSGATGDEIDVLREKAKEMGATTKFTASEAADAFNYMAMAGWKTEEMLGGIDGILNLAAASGADLATTSDIVTDALTAMGYKAKDAGRLADVMAAASSNANTNVEMMGATFQYAAPLVGALGYNMEDTAVAIGLMANAGIKGEKAGTALRSVFTRLAAPPKECATAMEQLGISLTDSSGKMKPFSRIMEELREKMSGLSETEQTGIAKHIAGQEAMSGLLAIVNAAPADFAKLTKAVAESSGSAEKMSETMLDNVGGDFTMLKSQFEGVQLQVYEKLVPALRNGMKQISTALKGVNWDNFGTTAGKALTKVISGLTWVLKNGKTIGTIITAMIAAFAVSKLNSWTTTLSGAIVKMISLTTATIAQTTATGAGTVATKLFNAAWKANPLGIVLTVVAALTAGIIALTKATTQEDEAAKARNESAQQKIDSLKEEADSYNQLKQAQVDQAAADLAGIANAQRLKDELSKLADENGNVKESDRARAEFILGQLNQALGTEYALTGNQISNYQQLQSEISKTIEVKKAEILLAAQQEVYTEAVKKYGEAEKKSAQLAQEAAAQEEIVSQKRAELKDAEQKALSTHDIASQQFYARRAKELKESLGVEEDTLSKKEEAYNTNEATLKNYFSDISTYETASQQVLEGNTSAAIQTLERKNAGFRTAASVAEKSAADQKKILEQQVIDTEVNARLMKDRYNQGVEGVTKEMVETAQKQADSAKSEFEKVGGNITKGIAQGAEQQEWTLTGTMNKLINGAVKAAEKAGLIHSPSRLFRDRVGVYLGEGIAVGIEKSTKDVNKSVTGLITSSASSAKSTFKNSGFDKVGQNVLKGATDSINKYVKTSTTSVKTLVNGSIESYANSIDDKIKKVNKSIKKQTANINANKKLSAAQKKSMISKIKDSGKAEIAELKKNESNYKKAGQASVKAYTDALKDFSTKATEAVGASMDKVNAKFQDKYTALVTSQQTLNEKLSGIGELFTLNENGTMTINNLKNQTQEITKYANDLNKLKGKVSANLFDAVSEMSVEDSQKYMDKLFAMSKKELSTYNSLYSQKLDAANSLSETIYNKDLKNLNTQYNGAVDTALKGLGDKLTKLGGQSMKGFISGMTSQKSSMESEVKKIADDVVKQFKKSLKIKSPSRVFANEVGKYIPSGIALGIKNNAKSMIKSVQNISKQAIEMSQQMLSGMNEPRLALAGVGSTTTNVVNNFTQTINAPKQPSRIELYRQTKNLLSIKGVQ